MRVTVNVEQVGDIIKLELIWQLIDPSQKEAEVFEASRDQHGGGLNQLVEYLQTL